MEILIWRLMEIDMSCRQPQVAGNAVFGTGFFSILSESPAQELNPCQVCDEWFSKIVEQWPQVSLNVVKWSRFSV